MRTDSALSDFLKTPNMVTQARGHARSDPQRLVDSGEVIVYGVDRNHRLVILNFLRECVGQSGEAPHAHSHTQVVALHEGRAHALRVRIAAHYLHVTANANGGRIARVVPQFYI